MVVRTHLVVAHTVKFVTVVLILPAQPCIDGEAPHFQRVIGKNAPDSSLLSDVVVGREAALGEVAGAVNGGCLLSKG